MHGTVRGGGWGEEGRRPPGHAPEIGGGVHHRRMHPGINTHQGLHVGGHEAAVR